MPLLAGGRGEKKAIRIVSEIVGRLINGLAQSTRQLRGKRSQGQRNSHQQRSARRVLRKKNLDLNFTGLALDSRLNPVGWHGFSAAFNCFRSRELQANVVRSAQHDGLLGNQPPRRQLDRKSVV